jgi:hypothetical protein
MKTKPAWEQVALIAVLLAAVILSHAFTPSAAAAVISIVSTLVGAFFVDRKKLAGDKEEGEK